MYELFSGTITKHDVDRVTDKSIFIKGFRQSKVSRYGGWFDTFYEAKFSLIEKCTQDLQAAQKNLDVARRKLILAEEMKG